jgi:flagellar export protein FliJ
MAFRYPLNLLLRLQQSLEKQEEQRLIALASAVEALRRKIEQLDTAQTERKRAALSGMEESGGSTGSEMHFAAVADQANSEKRSELLLELKSAEERKEEQAQVYREVRRRRETLASLHDHQRRAYDLEAARREQERTDEAFLIRQHSRSPE